MKRMISLLAAMMLVSSCGTAPRADLLSESRVTLDEAQGESEMAHYLIGGAVVIVALCTVVPGAKRGCQKLFISSETFQKGLGKRIKKLKEKEQTEKIKDQVKKLEDMKEEAEKSGKDGIFFPIYDKTIGSIVRKIRKTDEQSVKSGGGEAKTTDDTAESAGDSGQQSAKSGGGEAKATDDTAENADAGNQGAKSGGDEASKQSTDQQK